MPPCLVKDEVFEIVLLNYKCLEMRFLLMFLNDEGWYFQNCGNAPHTSKQAPPVQRGIGRVSSEEVTSCESQVSVRHQQESVEPVNFI